MKTSIKTIKLPLVIPNAEVRGEIDRAFRDFRWIYDEAAKRMPSLPRNRIEYSNDYVYYEWVKEFRRKGIDLPAQVAQQAVAKARESYASMLSNKNFNVVSRSKNNLLRFHNQCFHIIHFGNMYFVDIPLRSGRGHRVILPFKGDSYSSFFLEQISKKILVYGASELKKYGEEYSFNLTVKQGIEYNERATPIGIDFGLKNIAVAAAMSEDGPKIKLWRGKKAQHKRRKYLEKIASMQKKGMLKKVKSIKSTYRNYMKTVNHQVSREIVDFAASFFGPYIVLENLHKFRKQNDWTFSELRIFIEYKALENGIPVIAVNPKNTSNKCNKCNHTTSENRTGILFKCLNCGYQANADVNAAINLASSPALKKREVVHALIE